MPIEFRNRIDHPWLSLPPIRVGKIPSGLGEPHRYITIKTPEKLVRVDGESGFPYEEAILLPDFAIMAIGHCIFFVNLVTRDVRTVEADRYFCDLRLEGDALLAASASQLFKLSHDGNIIWESKTLGVDGMKIDDIVDGVIHGEYCWEPPEDWRPFAISLDSGEIIEPPSAT